MVLKVTDVSKIDIRPYLEVVIKKPVAGISPVIIAVSKIKVMHNPQVETRILGL